MLQDSSSNTAAVRTRTKTRKRRRKHNKRHRSLRQFCPSHPVTSASPVLAAKWLNLLTDLLIILRVEVLLGIRRISGSSDFQASRNSGMAEKRAGTSSFPRRDQVQVLECGWRSDEKDLRLHEETDSKVWIVLQATHDASLIPYSCHKPGMASLPM